MDSVKLCRNSPPVRHGAKGMLYGPDICITYCHLCWEVMGTDDWCRKHRDEINFQGCVESDRGHELWDRPLDVENVLVVWKEEGL